MDYYQNRYLAQNRRRAVFRPRVRQFGDRYYNRDQGYWRYRMGQRQLPYNVPVRMDAQARARRAPWRNRVQFAQAYGADADYDEWQNARRYRPEDLDDPDVFDQIVVDRRVNFAPDVYRLEPEDLIELEEEGQKRELEDAEEDTRSLKKIKSDDA